MIYEVIITETLAKTVRVEAKTYTAAINKAKDHYRAEDIVLTADDFTGAYFDADEDKDQTTPPDYIAEPNR